MEVVEEALTTVVLLLLDVELAVLLLVGEQTDLTIEVL